MAETFAVKNLNRMNIHEFTTIMLFYLQHDAAVSKLLMEQMIAKLNDSLHEFNEFQLTLF